MIHGPLLFLLSSFCLLQLNYRLSDDTQTKQTAVVHLKLFCSSHVKQQCQSFQGLPWNDPRKFNWGKGEARWCCYRATKSKHHFNTRDCFFFFLFTNQRLFHNINHAVIIIVLSSGHVSLKGSCQHGDLSDRWLKVFGDILNYSAVLTNHNEFVDVYILVGPVRWQVLVVNYTTQTQPMTLLTF